MMPEATNAIQREPLSARSARSREGGISAQRILGQLGAVEGDSGDHGDPDPGPPGPGPPSEPRKPSSGLSGDRSGEPSPAGSLGLQGGQKNSAPSQRVCDSARRSCANGRPAACARQASQATRPLLG